MEDRSVCSYKHVRTFDNFLRPLIHRPKVVFAPHVKPGMRVMDAGCGAGFASVAMAKLVGDGGEVVAVDLQPEMLDMVRRRAEKAGLADIIKLHRCEADSLNVEGEFDFANAFWMVHETPNPKHFLEQVYAVLKPGGRLFIAEPKMHVSKRDYEELIAEAEEIGYRIYDKPGVLFSYAVVLEKRASN
jgi:ubiquinone/menaquinone biosynthesis C-methylase UbiE